jgi:cytoskeletal protein CcmA (bactofilin family)
MADTIIGPNITIEGDISGADALTVLGVIRGRIQSKEGVVVAASGRVEAEIESSTVEVAGSVQGNISATSAVELKAGARLVGDVRAPRILIADGASFKGNINMQG